MTAAMFVSTWSPGPLAGLMIATIGASFVFVAFAGTLVADPPRVALQRQRGAYIDERHLTALSFGAHSHWLQPWRASSPTGATPG